MRGSGVIITAATITAPNDDDIDNDSVIFIIIININIIVLPICFWYYFFIADMSIHVSRNHTQKKSLTHLNPKPPEYSP